MLRSPSIPPLDSADLEAASDAIFGAVSCAAIVQDRPLEMIGPEDPLTLAVSRLWWRRVGALPVLEGSQLVGCFAEEDLLRLLAARLRRLGAEASGSGLSVWSDELLGGQRVADAMTVRKDLPVVAADQPLSEGLALCTGPGTSPGRYLFVLGSRGTGDGLQLASFRDMARYLTALYDAGAANARLFATPETETRARAAVQRVLGLPIATARERFGLGHEANIVPIESSAAEVIEAMASRRRGYVLVTQREGRAVGSAEGGPIGICTRRDVLRVCAPRHARLGSLRLAGWMSPRVRTVTGTDTLFGLFKLMGLESCRHMPLVDDWDRVEGVISMAEGIALVAGRASA